MSDEQSVSTIHQIPISGHNQNHLIGNNEHETEIPSQSQQPSDYEHHANVVNLSQNFTQMMAVSPLDIAAANGPIRVPGTYPPDWVLDRDVDSCTACKSPFTLIKRRHHCRSCGRIFCGDCCKVKAKLLYMNNKEARVCNNCYDIIEYTLTEPGLIINSEQPNNIEQSSQRESNANTGLSGQTSLAQISCSQSAGATRPIIGVLKSTNAATRSNDSSNTSSNSSEHHFKQVMFADGIRPGTDLTEPNPVASSSSVGDISTRPLQSFLSRQYRRTPDGSSSSGTNGSRKTKSSRSTCNTIKNITVCDELGYLPPIVISKDAPIINSVGSKPNSGFTPEAGSSSTSNTLINLVLSQIKTAKTTNQAPLESRSCLLDGIVKFEDISSLLGIGGVITLLLLKDFELRVKIVKKDCCMMRPMNLSLGQSNEFKIQPGISDELLEDQAETNRLSLHDETHGQLETDMPSSFDDVSTQEYWCFLSNGLRRLGQEEVLLVIDKDKDDACIPRDIFKIYLTIHELALRRQTLEHLGNLLFQDGLFGNRDTAGLLLVKPPINSCLDQLVIPSEGENFLVALVLQRWEVPWSKVFPMRLLLRLGYNYKVYPYPIVSFRTRNPVYYEIGHTIISILGDFRNFRYSLTHVDGLEVTINKSTRKVLIQLAQSNYQQFNKVLDSANNEHVLAWSACPSPESDGHLVCAQNEDGQYETVEFLNDRPVKTRLMSFKQLGSGPNLGASFIVFSGALKVNQTGQPAKISIVEDGLLIQIQSCTMAALKNAIHFMHHFDIDCENSQDLLNRVEIDWQPD